MATNRWTFNKKEILPSNFCVPETNLLSEVHWMIDFKKQADSKFKNLANVSLVYEDIIEYLHVADVQKQNRPINYDSLKLQVERILDGMQAK